MESLGWLKSFETGNAVIDGQHRELLACLKEIATLMGEAKGEETHAKCQELQRLIETHFAAEESLLHESRFSRLDAHIASHRETAKDFEHICTSCKSACKDNCAGPCLPEMAVLLVSHFLHGDLDFKSFLQVKGLANGNR